MFKRREKLSWKKRLSGYLWPQGGWKRYGRFILLKLHRLGGTPRSIAAGFACGAAISFTPFVGFHMILAAATAFLLRGNIIASAERLSEIRGLFRLYGFRCFIRGG